MEWRYLIEELTSSEEDNEQMLWDVGSGGWEAATSWSVPGDLNIDKGAWRVYILFKKPK